MSDKGEQRWIWPTLIFDPETHDPRIVAFEIDRDRSTFRIRTSEDGGPLFTDVRDVEPFTRIFPYERDPYHPNEVAAEAFSTVVLEEIRSRAPSPGTDAVRSWFRKNLSATAQP